jgi:hypothetical protein
MIRIKRRRVIPMPDIVVTIRIDHVLDRKTWIPQVMFLDWDQVAYIKGYIDPQYPLPVPLDQTGYYPGAILRYWIFMETEEFYW